MKKYLQLFSISYFSRKNVPVTLNWSPILLLASQKVSAQSLSSQFGHPSCHWPRQDTFLCGQKNMSDQIRLDKDCADTFSVVKSKMGDQIRFDKDCADTFYVVKSKLGHQLRVTGTLKKN